MDHNGLMMLLFLGLGTVLAIGFELFESKVAFAKKHSALTTLGFLGLFILASVVAAIYTHQFNAWILLAIPFFIAGKIKESREKSRKDKALIAQWQGQLASALESRDGKGAVELDISKAPDTVRSLLIRDAKAKGLKVESIKDETTGALCLRLSDRNAG